MSTPLSEDSRHYAYVYRSNSGKPLYVGYGASAVRSAAHLGNQAHNQELTAALKNGNYTLDIAGPFGDEQRAKAVETALISVFRLEPTLCNANKGHTSWRFRSLGVPNEFARRVDKAALDREASRTLAKRAGGIIVVNINYCDLGDGRRGDLLANVSSNAQLRQRIDRFWQRRGHAERPWVPDPQRSPGLPLAVSGRGSMRMVIASVRIDRRGCGIAVDGAQPGGLLCIPSQAEPDDALDAYQVRGRRISLDSDLRFGRLIHELFIVLDEASQIVKGGRKSTQPYGSGDASEPALGDLSGSKQPV
jgi:hypothetical protein